MKNTKKVKELEKELEELRLKVSTLEEGLKSAEIFINNIKNNAVPVSPVTSNNSVNPAIPVSPVTSNNSVNPAIPVIPFNSLNPANSVNPLSPDNSSEVPKESRNNNNNNLVNSTSITNFTIPAPPPEAHHSNITNDVPVPVVIDANENNTIDQDEPEENTTKKSNTESWIGKILMGVLASLLVFIALVTFAKVLLPYLTDTVKIILMFVASILLTVIGFIFRKKKPENTLFIALLGCGSTCIYLSILVTGIYFKAISSIVMYVLIALWAIFVIFLKKNKNDWLYFTIGNLGYIVSIVFSVGQNDKSLIIPILIYAVMINVVYQIMYWKNEYQRHAQNVINSISLLVLQLIMSILFKKITEVIIVGIVAVTFALISMITYTVFDLFNYKKEHFIISAINIAIYIIEYFFINALYKMELPIILSFIVIIIPAVVLELINMYWRKKKLAEIPSIVNTVFSGIIFALATVIIYLKSHFLFYSGIILVIYSLIVAYGIIQKDQYFKIQGWVLVVICMIAGYSLKELSFTIVATILTLTSLIVEAIVINDSEPFKIVSYIVLLGWIIRIGGHVSDMELFANSSNVDDIITIVVYGIMALLNVVMVLTKFYRTKGKDEEGRKIRIVLDGLNLIYMFFGLIMMESSREVNLKIIYMLIAIALACVNLPVKDKGTRNRYLYTGIKFAFILYYILWIFKTPKFVISICMIAFAVICVTFGFWNRPIGKKLRIFGLAMSIIFVIKLIIADISYDSSVMKAVSYLICGILCFGISAIYNYFEKKQKRSE